MKKFFGGSDKKHLAKKHSSNNSISSTNSFPPPYSERDRDDDHHPRSEPSSPTKSSSRSPTKSHSQSHSPTKRTSTSSRPAASSRPEASRSPRPSRSSRHNTDSSTSSSRRPKFEPDTHPLNLPPEERRRLSTLAQSAMSGAEPMDIDREPVNGAMPTSPKNASAQANFSVPITNGTTTNGTTSGAENDGSQDAPAPPPHSSNPSSPVTTPAEDAESYKVAGNRHFKEKNYDKAIEQYTKALDLFPDSAIYLGNRAAAYMAKGQWALAMEDCKRSADLDPENTKVLLRLARIYTSVGQPDEALITFNRIHPEPSAKDLQPAKDMLFYLNSAQSNLESGRALSMVLHALDEAEKRLGVGVSRPRKWQLMRGETYLKKGDENSLGEALSIALNLLRSNSQDPEALVLRGRVMYAQGENEKALQLFRMALNCDPDYRDAVKWLRIVQKLDRMKEAGNVEFKAGRYDSAIEKFTEALTIDPTNKSMGAKLMYNRAQCKIKLKQYDEAIADAEEAVKLDPGHSKARKAKANALGQAGRWEDAVKEWKSIQELDPEDRSIQKEIRKAELELKKAQRKDYYKIMGLTKDCDQNEIKKAYKKMAVKLHPDKNLDDEHAEAKFKDMQEAYETLSDPQKRAAYDNGDDLLDPSDMFGGGGGMGGGMGGIDPEILFSMMNGGGGFGGGGGGFRGAGGAGGFPGGAQFNFGGGGGGRRQQGGFPPGGFQFS